MDVLELDQTTLPNMLKKHRSIFVTGVRANAFWQQGMEAYPFHQGALLVHAPEDEMRYPAMFLHSNNGKLIISQGGAPDWFDSIWDEHLCGIVEHRPFDFRLPDYSRPVAHNLPVKW